MYSKILVPLDGSDIAECVLPYVEAVAKGKNKLDVMFLYVIQPLDTPLTKHEFRAQIESEAKAAAENYLNELIEKLTYNETVRSEVIIGEIAESIVDYAAQNEIDVIIMATHGRSGIKRWVYGSVSDKVLHESNVPIWLIRADIPPLFSQEKAQKINILVPLDGSELAESVLDHIKKLANQLGEETVDIVLTRVCELFSNPSAHPPPMAMNWEEHLEYETNRCKDICQTYLSKVEEDIRQNGLNVRSEVLVGNPADAIIDFANKNAVNTIVMSTHGRTGIGRWALGSIADKILKGASCPIFLVRSKSSK